MSSAILEITGLSDVDCFYIVERHKSEFTYPLHRHREYELNFVQNGAGVRRIVGDSVEEIGAFDLVLIGGESLEHVWEQGSCTSGDIREITIQFSPELFGDNLLLRNQFAPMKRMMERAGHGLSFPIEAIMKVYSEIDTVASYENGFLQFLALTKILYELSTCNYRELASSSFAKAQRDAESHRIANVKKYINNHYNEDLGLETLAGLVGMNPTSFSRFFHQHANVTLSSYIIGIRLGYAARALVDTSQNISEICYSCGFSNLSNFNRVFKLKKGMSPKEFRSIYRKKKICV